MTHVLVVDDEPAIRRVLTAYLIADGFTVTEAETAAQARAGLAGVDLVLLDIGLPDTDGLELTREIRGASDVPVILVTARSEEVDTLVGLAVGADDYIAKPFKPREVVARVRTVLRRAAPSGRVATGRRLVAGDLVVDLDRRTVHWQGTGVELSALEFDLLAALTESPGRVFSRAQLLERVWGYDVFSGERVVDVHIRSLRQILGDDAGNPRIIGTVRGVGYKLLAGGAR